MTRGVGAHDRHGSPPHPPHQTRHPAPVRVARGFPTTAWGGARSAPASATLREPRGGKHRRVGRGVPTAPRPTESEGGRFSQFTVQYVGRRPKRSDGGRKRARYPAALVSPHTGCRCSLALVRIARLFFAATKVDRRAGAGVPPSPSRRPTPSWGHPPPLHPCTPASNLAPAPRVSTTLAAAVNARGAMAALPSAPLLACQTVGGCGCCGVAGFPLAR